ncbi:MAG TPA: hypothetical protein VJ836_03165 [Candidatus Saccharimonadales bacterium]|nr:hypothetical protein [Candidatus Saccharimonadales bacterium]
MGEVSRRVFEGLLSSASEAGIGTEPLDIFEAATRFVSHPVKAGV